MQAWIGPAIIATVIASVFGFLRDRHFDGKRRQERVKDIQIALLAEIRAYVAVLVRDRLDEFEQGMLARMQGDKNFVPFIPREKNDTFFQAILADIHILPESSIDPVVVYYSQIVAIAEMALDMRTKMFAELEMQRRMDVYRNFISMKQEAVVLGLEAETMLDLHIRSGRQGVDRFLAIRSEKELNQTREQVENWLNSRVSDLSDR
ncbi:MAG: hypothetical protein L3J33_00215 [Rhodobacteraceae bacterium]|nr:hypothetical protein [Paracoccaceae bacterium]